MNKIKLLSLALLATIIAYAQSPILVKDIRTGSNSSSPNNLINIGSNIFFAGNNGFNGTELYKTDGTTSGTILVKDINTSSGTGSSCQYFVNLNGTLIFVADNGTNGFEIWKSDGTNAGTILVSDINPGTNDGNPINLTVMGNFVYFSGTNGVDGIELWRTDGTAAGTTMVKDLWSGSGNGSPAYITNVNGTLFFQANDGFNGVELWKSDGTAAGTTLVKDIYLGFNSSNPNALTNINGTLYFTAETATNGGEMWKSNGTSAGTVLVKDINAGTNASNPSGYTLSGTDIFFSAYTQNNGYELWKTDGTANGTSLVKDINNGNNGSSITSLLVVNGQLYFSANDGAFGSELWTSNGTTAGTYMLSDINPGANGSTPVAMMQYNNVLYFRATTVTNGAEMYRSDGTAAGTILVTDMALGGISSDAGGFVPMNGTLYFPANDAVVGRELWKYTPPTCVPPNPNLAVADVTACAGQGNTASINISNTEAGTNYQPFFGQTPVGASIAGIAGQSIGLTLLTNTLNYGANNLIIKVTKNGCPASQLNDTSIVTVIGTQDQNVTVSGGEVCAGSSAIVTLHTPQAGVTYQAQINGVNVGASFIATANDTTITIPSSALTQGDNQIDIQASGTQNCPAVLLIDTAIVHVSGLPATAGGTGASVCNSGSVMLHASGAQNNQTYHWYTTQTGGTPIVGVVGLMYNTPVITSTTIYYVALVKQNGCESATRFPITATVNLSPSTAPTITAISNLNICNSGSTTLFLQGAAQGNTYLWYSTPTGGVPIATGASYSTPTINTSTTYYFAFQSTEGCIGSRNNALVNVETLPSAPATTNAAICGSGQASLSANGAATGNSYQWYSNATGNTPFANDTLSNFITPVITATTTYYVSIISVLGCESATRTAAIATVNVIPNNATTTGAARCGNGTVNLTASGATTGQTYNWYASNIGGTSLNNTSSYTTSNLSSTTIYYVSITGAGNCESATLSPVTATINAIPANATVTNASRCGAGTVTLTATGGTTFQWYTTATGNTQIAIANATTYTTSVLTSSNTYYVVIVGAGNCESATRTAVTATINSIPTPPTNGVGGSVCGSGSVTITAGSINANETYQWFTTATGNTIIIGATTASYTTPSISASTTYYVGTVSAASCESNTRTAVIATVNALPIAPTAVGGSVCGSGAITLTASGAANSQTYQWYTTLSGSTTINGEINATYSTPIITATTNYFVTIVSAQNCESATRTQVTATINALPSNATVTNASNCGNGVLMLMASGAQAGETYQWFTTQTGTTPINGVVNSNFTTPNLTSTTNYFVSVISAQNCVSSVRTQATATIFALPNAPTVTSVSRCAAGTVILTASGSTVYAWYNTNNSSTPIAGATSTNYTTPILSQTTNFYVAAISADGCESGTRSTATAIINPLPAVPTITANGATTFCSGDSITLTANTLNTVQSWSTNETDLQITVTQTGNYSVTIVDANSCTATSLTMQILVNPTPVTPVIAANGNTIFCAGDSVSLTTGNATSYIWSNGSTQQNINVNATGSYTVQITNQFGCISANSTSMTVVVNQNPATPVISSNSTIICASNPITLSAPSGFINYAWSNNTNSQTIFTAIAGNYTVTVTDANFCTAISNTLVVTNIPSPTAPTISAQSNIVCSGTNLLLNASSGFAGYLWSNGATTSSISVNVAGNYTVTGYFCSGTNNLQSTAYTVTLNPFAQASITGTNNICPLNTTTLTASAGVSYLWNSGATTQTVNGSAGNYSVVVTDANGCISNATSTVAEFIVTQATITANVPTNLCPNTTVVLNANAASGYLWNNFTVTQILSVNSTGCYSVTTTDANGCSSTSVPLCLNYLTGVPTPNIVSTDTALCAGETSVLTCTNCPLGGVNYLWSNGLNSQSQTLSNSACLSLSISDINGCAASSNSVCVTTLTTPANPIITFDNNNGQLTATAVADNYTWIADGQITTFTTQNIYPNNNGSYTVIANNNNGCSSDTSLSFNYLFTGITPVDVIGGFNMYPNPATDFVTLSIENSNKVTLQIFDNTGKQVYDFEVSNENGNITEKIDLSGLAGGLYFVKVSYNGKVKSLKFVKG